MSPTAFCTPDCKISIKAPPAGAGCFNSAADIRILGVGPGPNRLFVAAIFPFLRIAENARGDLPREFNTTPLPSFFFGSASKHRRIGATSP